jgi:hypothetical protein
MSFVVIAFRNPRDIPSDPYSQTESLTFATCQFFVSQTRNSAFVFIAAKLLLIRSIDFFFQNFSNRTNKNNQLDTRPCSQYFSPTG